MNLLAQCRQPEWVWPETPEDWQIEHHLLPPAGKVVENARHVAWSRSHQHSHPYREILLCLRGTGTYRLKSRLLEYGPGTAFFIERDIPHDIDYPAGTTDADHLWIPLAPGRFNVNLITLRGGKPVNQISHRILLTTEGLGIDPAVAWPSPGRAEQISVSRLRLHLLALTCVLVTAIAESFEKGGDGRDTTSFQSEIINVVSKHILVGCGRGDTIEGLARLAGYSKYHFVRIFKEHMMCTVHEYINQCRWEKTMELIQQGWTKKSIGEYLGFSSPSSFCRWFRLQHQE